MRRPLYEGLRDTKWQLTSPHSDWLVDEGALADGLLLLSAADRLDEGEGPEGGSARTPGGDEVAVDGDLVLHLGAAAGGDATVAARIAAGLLALEDLAGVAEEHARGSADGADDLASLEVLLEGSDNLGILGKVLSARKAARSDDGVEGLVRDLSELDIALDGDVEAGRDDQVAVDSGNDNLALGALEEIDRGEGLNRFKAWGDDNTHANHSQSEVTLIVSPQF